MTYKDAVLLYKKKFGKSVKTCHIADVLDHHGKITRKAPNRKDARKYPCPKSVKPNLELVLKELKMI